MRSWLPRLRRLAYGYRAGEVKLPELAPIKKDAEFIMKRTVERWLTRRPPVMADVGCGVEGVTPCHPDPIHAPSMVLGSKKRYACAPPPADKKLLSELREFSRKWVRDNLSPIAPDADTSVAAWLEKTNYPEWRRAELRELLQRIEDPKLLPTTTFARCKSFMKMETYPEYKHFRGINARVDEAKLLFGPITKLMEEVLYESPYFIKHIPVADRPAYITQRLLSPGARYIATDYTSFEALFTREFMEATEFELYEWLSSSLPEGQQFMRYVRGIIGGTNVCSFRDFNCRLKATRMSGDMCTSLGNGFANLIVMLFVLKKFCGLENPQGVVEGDDGLFTILGPSPPIEAFTRLGLRIKLEVHSELSEASFCGLVFDPVEQINVTDPRKVLATFGWIGSQYVKARSSKQQGLLRCKALSLAHQYPGCPIICALADYGLFVTRGLQIGWVLEKNRMLSQYDRERLLLAMSTPVVRKEPGARTRALVEKMYGISSAEQLRVESYLRSLTRLQPLSISLDFPRDWRDYNETYVLEIDCLGPRVDQPDLPVGPAVELLDAIT